LTSLRATLHALRGWPTTLGVAINSMTKPFGPQGNVIDLKVGEQLTTLFEQAVTFARMRIGLEAS
jgi:FMN reductase